MISNKIQKGKLIISEPSLYEPESVFNRSIILLTDYNYSGAVGFILNKPLDYTLNDLVPEVKFPFKIYQGGPVEQENLYFVHNVPDQIPNSIEITKDLYWGGDFEGVVELINLKKINEDNIKFFLGYSGWKSGQLEEEYDDKAWIVIDNKYQNLLSATLYTDFWRNQLLQLGNEYKIWSNAPEDPMLN